MEQNYVLWDNIVLHLFNYSVKDKAKQRRDEFWKQG